MTDKKHITASDLSSGETIRHLVRQKWPSVLCFFPVTAPRSEEFERAIVIGFSGEDFVLLLPEAGLQQASATAAKIRKVFSEKPCTDGRETRATTISVGLASLKDHKPHNHTKELSSQSSLALLREKLNRIHEKTRTSAIASLQLLAKKNTGTEHQAHIVNAPRIVPLLGEQIILPEKHTGTFQNSTSLSNICRFLLYNDLLNPFPQLKS